VNRPVTDSHGARKSAYQVIVECADQRQDCVLALVLQTHGSTPCKAGASAILDRQSVRYGTIGGGMVEATARQRASGVLESGRPAVFTSNFHGGEIVGDEPVCGGSMRVLLDPATARYRDAFAAASALTRRRRRGVLLTTLQGDDALAVEHACFAEDADLSNECFPDAEAIREVLKREEARLLIHEATSKSQRLEVLVQPVLARPMLVIVGGGHVGQALAAQAHLVGFDLVVIDDRDEFTRPELFPSGTAIRRGAIPEQLGNVSFHQDTYVVLVTRGHQHDAEALAVCLHQPTAYLGMIGSRRKISLMRGEFVQSGRATAEDFESVYAPIGLDLGSVTVPEIAASIVAQLIAVRRNGTAPRIRTE